MNPIMPAEHTEATVAPPTEVVDALTVLRAAEDEVARAKLALRDAAASCQATREQVIEMYWSVPEVTAEVLAGRLGMTAGKAAHSGLWGSVVIGRCGTCQEEVRERSRTAATHEPPQFCKQCRQRESGAWRTRLAIHSEAVAQLATMPYVDYLTTEHWQRVRQAALRRARWRCQICNASGALDVHHRSYERRGAEWASDLVALCRGCHARHHGKPERVR